LKKILFLIIVVSIVTTGGSLFSDQITNNGIQIAEEVWPKSPTDPNV
jgi:hypothetical protein